MMANLWDLGYPRLRYDSDKENGGQSRFVDEDDVFDLQRILHPTPENPWCNCVDLAMLVHVAADSIGGKSDPNEAHQEIMVSLVHLWAYMIR